MWKLNGSAFRDKRLRRTIRFLFECVSRLRDGEWLHAERIARHRFPLFLARFELTTRAGRPAARTFTLQHWSPEWTNGTLIWHEV
jgi:hypothetical protein